MSEPETMVIRLLQKMHADMNARFRGTAGERIGWATLSQQVRKLTQRMDRLEEREP